MNIPDEYIQEMILNKVKLFAKESYFEEFSKILTELSINILAFNKKDSLSHTITVSSTSKNKPHKGWWKLITKLILAPDEEISKADDELNQNNLELNINPLCFAYLKYICHQKMRKLLHISKNENISLNLITNIYLNLCQKQINLNKEMEFERRRNLKFNRQLKKKQNSSDSQNQEGGGELSTLRHQTKKIEIKKLPQIQQLEYSNSFTRLFIGETDKESIREQYLSNMVVKKHRQLHLSSFYDITSLYLKKMYYKLFKQKEEKKASIDSDMINVINKFETNHKILENYQRNSNEKTHSLDSSKMQLLQTLHQKTDKYSEMKKNLEKKRKNFFMFNFSSKNHEIPIFTNSLNEIGKKIYHIGTNNLKNNKYNSSLGYSYRQFHRLFIEEEKKLHPIGNISIDKKVNKNFIKSISSMLLMNNKKEGNSEEKNLPFLKTQKERNPYKPFFIGLRNNKKKKVILKNFLNKNDFFFSKL